MSPYRTEVGCQARGTLAKPRQPQRSPSPTADLRTISELQRPRKRSLVGALPVLPALLTRTLTALRRMLGMPDYAAHLAHLRAKHPDCPEPTEREFYDQYVRSRYGDGTSRCC